MARCPFAEWDPKGTTPGGVITPRVVILHVTDGEGDAHPHDHLEWHFEIFYDGRIQQQVDTSLRADANNKANKFAISIETEGKAGGEWTPEQLASIDRLLRWINKTHAIPLVVCTDPYGSGVGFHTMFGAPSAWTPYVKSCPGPNRKTQFWNDIVPALLNPTEENEVLTWYLEAFDGKIWIVPSTFNYKLWLRKGGDVEVAKRQYNAVTASGWSAETLRQLPTVVEAA